MVSKKRTVDQSRPYHLDLRGGVFELPRRFSAETLERLTKVVRGLIFAAVEAAQSGHPGGSSSKVEMTLALLLGRLAFSASQPKHPCRDRLVWSAGHCTPLHYALQSLIYECQRRQGNFSAPHRAVLPEDLVRFRHVDGPQGHVESEYPLADACTGSSGHGLSAALGLALSHRGSGLDTRVWAIVGDAETEEGMTYEARNLAVAAGADNLVALVDYNRFGIDGPITEVIRDGYVEHWSALGWNVIEVSGHDFGQLLTAFRRLDSSQRRNGRPTAIIAHATKGKAYGAAEDTAGSHGTPAKHDEYVAVMRELGFAVTGASSTTQEDIQSVLATLRPLDVGFVVKRLRVAERRMMSEDEAVAKMRAALPARQFISPIDVTRPEELPPELQFVPGQFVPTRKATEAFFRWLMKQSAFFYVGTGDLSKSILTAGAEDAHGLITPDNPAGRGLRFGIAEQNMAMTSVGLTQDVLPGGFRPAAAFGSYAVFSPMMANAVRMGLIGNAVNPAAAGFFILLAAHDGPETGEDGPTHQGLFWMSLFQAYPGIKVYKPFDANETVEMLFHALRRGEPIALSVMRPGTPVLERGEGRPAARAACDGAYVWRPHSENGRPKLTLAVSGTQVLLNVLAKLPELEVERDVKIVNVTSPELFEELRQSDPARAAAIFADDERPHTITVHNGWSGFLNAFLLPTDGRQRAIGIDSYLRSGNVTEAYQLAGMDAAKLVEKILSAAKGVA